VIDLLESRGCALRGSHTSGFWSMRVPKKLFRHDADDHEWLALDGEPAADERSAEDGARVREGAGPQAMAKDDRHAAWAGVFICRAEGASRRRGCAEHGEVVAGDHLGEGRADVLVRPLCKETAASKLPSTATSRSVSMGRIASYML
jgi:hypothetical protein